MPFTPELKAYLKRLSKTDPELADKIFGFEEEEDIIPKTFSAFRNMPKEGEDYKAPKEKEVRKTDDRFDNVTPASLTYTPPSPPSSGKAGKDLGQQSRDELQDVIVFGDTRYELERDANKDLGYDVFADSDAQTESSKEEKEDSWWSDIQERLSGIGDWFGSGSSNTGMLGGQDRNVRLSGKSPRARRAIERGVSRKY
jgi:hypothetical protein